MLFRSAFDCAPLRAITARSLHHRHPQLASHTPPNPRHGPANSALYFPRPPDPTTLNPLSNPHGDTHQNHPTCRPHNPHSSPARRTEIALQTGYSHKLPVVRSQCIEPATLARTTAQQRHGKDTPMARQRLLWKWVRRGSQRADVALAVRHQPALIR